MEVGRRHASGWTARAWACATVGVLAVLGAATAAPALAAPGDVTLVSRADTATGAKGTAGSFDPSSSGDGRYVAFASAATNLAPGVPSGAVSVFVRDRQANTTTLVSRATGAAGAPAGGFSSAPAISADGTVVAFQTSSTLSPDDTDDRVDVYVRNLQTSTTTLVSRGPGAGGAKAADGASAPSISGDGRYVAFETTAANLGGDGSAHRKVYVRDLGAATPTTTLASVADASTTTAADDDTDSPSISADGQRVAFTSTATNLAADDTKADDDVFVRDLGAYTTTLASRAPGLTGTPAAGNSFDPALSGDGKHVVFTSNAPNLNAFNFFANISGFGLHDWVIDVFERDLTTGDTEQISVGSGALGDLGDGTSDAGAVSGDGSLVAFETVSTNLSAADGDDTWDVYVRDTIGAKTSLVSRAAGSSGAHGDGTSRSPALAGDGHTVVLASDAANLSPDDPDHLGDVLARRLAPTAPYLTATTPASGAADNDPKLTGGASTGATVRIYSGPSCSGSPVATGTAAAFASPGISVHVADDTTTTFSADALDDQGAASSCSPNTVTYVQQTATPAPQLTGSSPASPADSTSPRIVGSAPAASTVSLYANATCTGTPAATGTAAALASPGIAVTVTANSSTTFHATETNQAGTQTSQCSPSSVTFVADQKTPDAPTVVTTNPLSPANSTAPRIRGSAESGSAVKLYTNATCTSAVAGTASAVRFSLSGVAVSVAPDSTSSFWATTTDQAGHTSGCSTTHATFVERSSLPAPGRTFVVTTSGDLVNDGCTASHCTLREAIEASNASPGRDTIQFTPGPTPEIMAPYGPLPVITDPVVIDGESASTVADGTPDVMIDLSRGPGGSYTSVANDDLFDFQLGQVLQPPPPPRATRYDGLVVQAPDSVISGVEVVAADGDGIVVRDAPRTVVRSSSTAFTRTDFYINADPPPANHTQVISPNMQDGIRVIRSPDTLIGGALDADRNVITYNAGNGISVDDQSHGTTIEGNVIGLDGAPYDEFGGQLRGNGGSGVSVDAGAGADVTVGGPGGARNVIGDNRRAGVEMLGGGGDVEGNWIGTDVAGSGRAGNAIGVLARGADGTRIGVPNDGNAIAGNRQAGVAVAVDAREAHDVRVQANTIGLTPVGANTSPNGIGVYIRGADGTLVGGTGAGEANTIRASVGAGVEVDGATAAVEGDSTQDDGGLGIDVLPLGAQADDAGDAAAPQNRPVIDSATTSAGGTVVTGHVSTAAGRSLRVEVYGQAACDLSGVGEGLTLLGTASPTADGGGQASFTVNAAQVSDGLNVAATATSTQTGTSEHSPCAVVRQTPPPPVLVVTTSADHDDGACDATDCSLREAIKAANANVGTDRIQFAIAGSGIPTITPASPLPAITGATLIDATTQRLDTGPGTPDVELSGASAGAGAVGLLVQGAAAGNSRILGLFVDRFSDDGIRLEAADASQIRSTWVGVSPGGAAAGNGGDGIELLGARDIRIGAPGAGVVVASNGGHGIVTRTSASRTSERLTLQSSRIGTDPSGTLALPNALAGVAMRPLSGGAGGAVDSLIGGTAPELGNLISGNGGPGVTLGPGAGAAVIESNLIGTTVDGKAALPNHGAGVAGYFSAYAAHVGAPGAGNLISGNTANGIAELGPGSIVTDNRIGTDITGTSAIANGGDGVSLIGGATILRNVVSGNLGDGLRIGNDFQSFLPLKLSDTIVGRSADNAAALGNGGNGVELSSEFNTSFGARSSMAGDVIADNGAAGLRDQSQAGPIDLSDDSFFDNAGLGIDRGEAGVTADDAGELVGPPNAPSLTSARRNGAGITIAGTVDTTPGQAGTVVTFFWSPSCDATGRGEGKTVIGTASVDTDSDGHAAFTAQFGTDVPAGADITALTAGQGGSGASQIAGSSEFSRCRVVPDVPIPAVGIADVSTGEGDSGTHVVAMPVSLSRTTSVQVTVDYTVIGDTATADVDFRARSGTLTIPAGATGGDIPITVVGDTAPEGDEFVLVQLDDAAGGTLAASRGALRIRDDDAAPKRLEVQAADAQVTEGDSGTSTVVVPVKLSAAPTGPVSVRWQTAGVGAAAPADFVAASGTLTFAAGETAKDITIDVVGDTVHEDTERFAVALTAPAGAAITRPTGIVTILDNDAAPVTPPTGGGGGTTTPPAGGGGGGAPPPPAPGVAPIRPIVIGPVVPPKQTPPALVKGVAAQYGCLNGTITGASARAVTETDLCVEGPSDLKVKGCVVKAKTSYRFRVTLKTVRRTKKGRIAVPRRRSLVTLVAFKLNGRASGSAKKRPFYATVDGRKLKAVNVLTADVTLRDPLKKHSLFHRHLTFTFRTCP